MDLAPLFGNLLNYEETKILRNEILRHTHKDRSVALYSNKSPQNSNTGFSNETEGEALVVERYISWNNKKTFGLKLFQSRTDLTTSKGYCTERKFVAEKKEGIKCFNCGGADHFPRKCKSKSVETSEDYE